MSRILYARLRRAGQGAGVKTIDHMVAMSDGALVLAVICPYVPVGTGAAESASRLQIRAASAAQIAARPVTVAAGVQAVVSADLSAQ